MTKFSAHLDRVSAIVDKWPEWKRNIFGGNEKNDTFILGIL